MNSLIVATPAMSFQLHLAVFRFEIRGLVLAARAETWSASVACWYLTVFGLTSFGEARPKCHVVAGQSGVKKTLRALHLRVG